MATNRYFLRSNNHASTSSDVGVLGAATPARGTTVVSPDLRAATVAACPRLRRNSSRSRKQQQQQAGSSRAKKQRLELSSMVVEASSARYGSRLLALPPPMPQLHYHHYHLRQILLSAVDEAPWRGFSAEGAGTDDQLLLLPPPMATEHPSRKMKIWRPAASSPSSINNGHMIKRAMTGRGAVERTPASRNTVGAMATARQQEVREIEFFPAKEGQCRAPEADAPAKEVSVIEFSPVANTNHTGGGGSQVSVPNESDLAPRGSSTCL